MRPKPFSAACAIASTAAGSATSASTATALPPAALISRDDGVGLRLVGTHVHHHRRAAGGKMQRDGAADIAAGAGDDGDLAGEFVVAAHDIHLPP